MAKTVYSLVLNDEVVAAIDTLAARQGYSRSALVNHILAEYASLVSAQGVNRRILDGIQAEAERFALRPHSASAGSLTLRTSLRYKYNPALSYVVELWEEAGALGRLKVTLRSQNEALLAYFQNFFTLWGALEEKYAANGQGPSSSLSQKRFSRNLRRPQGPVGDSEMGRDVAAYIGLLDDCLNIFFQYLDDVARAVRETEKKYKLAMDSGLPLTFL